LKLNDLPIDKLVLIRWKDIIEYHQSDDTYDPDDYSRKCPTFELVGWVKHLRRGILVVRPERGLTMDDEDGSEGFSGRSSQLIPAGCVDSVYELKIGKKLYSNPLYKDEVDGRAGNVGKDGGGGS